MKRHYRSITALVLLTGSARLAAHDSGYTLKVIEREGNRLELKFLTMPDDMRLVCEGDSRAAVGDYVKIEDRDGTIYAGNARCVGVKWLK